MHSSCFRLIIQHFLNATPVVALLQQSLTATLLIFSSSSIVRAGDAIYVRVGDHDLTQKYGSPGAQTLRVATTYIHHNHNSQTLDNDIAILKLHGEADLKEGVCLVCLPARGTSQQAGKKCTVTGYGYMGESELLQLEYKQQRGGGYWNTKTLFFNNSRDIHHCKKMHMWQNHE